MRKKKYILSVVTAEQAPFFGEKTPVGSFTTDKNMYSDIPSIEGRKLHIIHDPKEGGESKIVHEDHEGKNYGEIVIGDNSHGELIIPHEILGSFNVEGTRIEAPRRRKQERS